MAELQCPNCGAAGKVHAKGDGDLVCETCGGSFSWKAGEPKLKDVGELDKLKADVDEIRAENEKIRAGLARTGRLAPTEDPDREMPDQDPDEPVDGELEEEDEDL